MTKPVLTSTYERRLVRSQLLRRLAVCAGAALIATLCFSSRLLRHSS